MSLPRPVEPLQCRNKDCTRAEGGRCALAQQHPDALLTCPHLVREEEGDEGVGTVGLVGEANPLPRLPWPDRMTPGWVDKLASATSLRLFGVVGPFGSGKTSLLASSFLQLGLGRLEGHRFASSMTLAGWHQLVEQARAWSGEREGQIVGRTPRDFDVELGQFLHLGLCPWGDEGWRHLDVVLSDVSGEWFDALEEQDDAESRARLTFLKRCDGFMVLLDAERLARPEGRQESSRVAGIVRRLLHDERQYAGRRLALVLTKCDQIVERLIPPSGEAARGAEAWGELGGRLKPVLRLLDQARSSGWAVEVFGVSAFPTALAAGQPIGVLEPLAFLLRVCEPPPKGDRRNVPIPEGASPFEAMRRRDRDV